jgi:hypothetical protein
LQFVFIVKDEKGSIWKVVRMLHKLKGMLRVLCFLAAVELVRSKFGLSSYDDKIRVTSVFGTGRQQTTDSPGLIGEINTPIDTVYSVDENYLYMTDLNGGGLIRKLVVTSDGVASSGLVLYGVKTVFSGMELQYHLKCILITFISCQLQFLPIPGQE